MTAEAIGRHPGFLGVGADPAFAHWGPPVRSVVASPAYGIVRYRKRMARKRREWWQLFSFRSGSGIWEPVKRPKAVPA